MQDKISKRMALYRVKLKKKKQFQSIKINKPSRMAVERSLSMKIKQLAKESKHNLMTKRLHNNQVYSLMKPSRIVL